MAPSHRGMRSSAGAVLAVISLLMLSWRVEALTVGELVLKSVPNEPLRGVIGVRLEEGESLAALRVSVAPPERYAEQQLERPELLQGMQIALQARDEGRARIELFGEHPWQGEEVIVLLQLRWPAGEMERRFRIAPVNVESRDTAPKYVEVAENESLDAIAIRLSKQSNRSYMHMMVALFRANPSAFYRDNINNLKGGARLRVPTREELYRLSDAEVFATLRGHDQRRDAAREASRGEQDEKALLEQQLRQVTQEYSEIEQRNRELRTQLARLEQQMSELSRQLLELRAARDQAAEAEGSASPPDNVAADDLNPADDQERAAVGGLPAAWLLFLMLLVILSAAGIWRFAPRSGKGEA